MLITMDSKMFMKKMDNIIKYSIGFTEGIQKGKTVLFHNLGKEMSIVLGEYIDIQARQDPKAMHHVYEWYKTGSPEARLYNLTYTVSNLGLSFKSNFSQSQSLSSGSTEPFYNKASIMENGKSVTIEPKNSSILAFEINGEQVFTPGPITVDNPGGDQVAGSYEKVFDEFFSRYFKQSFLRASGLYEYLNNPMAYKHNLKSGSTGGREVGISTGYTWIANARVGG